MAADIPAVFLNSNDFAESHTIDGQANILCIIDDKSSPNQIDGVYVVRRQLFVNQETLGYRPIPGQKMNIDNEYFYIVDCIGEGLLEVILETRRS